jgi:hypothetical protein
MTSNFLGKPLLWALIAFAVLILGVSASWITFSLGKGVQSTDSNRTQAEYLYYAASISAATAFIVVGIGLVLLCRWIISAFRVFGNGIVDRLIGLGVITILFPEAVTSLIYRAIAALYGLWSMIPASILTVFELPADNVPILPVETLFTRGIRRLIDMLSFKVSNVWNSFFLNLAFSQLILAAVLWAFIGQGFQQLRASDDSSQPQGRLGRFLATMSPAGRQNLLLFTLLAIAAYLSLGAIAALPSLKGLNDPTAPTEESVQSTLEKVTVSKEVFDHDFPSSPGNMQDPVAELRAYAEPTAWERQGLKPDSDFVTQASAKVGTFIQTVDEVRRSALSDWQTIRNDARTANENLVRRAVASYTLARNTGNGKAELYRYQSDLQIWYEENWSYIKNQLQSRLRVIGLQDELMKNRARDARDQITRLRLQSVKLVNDQNNEFFLPSSDDVFAQYYMANGALGSLDGSPLPTVPAPGSNLGPFGFFSGWLVRTRSLPLALIIGMLGFGLMGSAISTFVQETKLRTKGAALVEDLAGVVLRGVSAAVVLFLAVEGGLAIIGSGGTDPNPYVLFFACLAAAVFSQRVWNWARDYLLSKLPANAAADGDNGVPSAQRKNDSGADAAAGATEVGETDTTAPRDQREEAAVPAADENVKGLVVTGKFIRYKAHKNKIIVTVEGTKLTYTLSENAKVAFGEIKDMKDLHKLKAGDLVTLTLKKDGDKTWATEVKEGKPNGRAETRTQLASPGGKPGQVPLHPP